MVMQLHWGVSVEKDAKLYTLGGDRDLAKSEQLHRFLNFLDWMPGGLGLAQNVAGITCAPWRADIEVASSRAARWQWGNTNTDTVYLKL